MKPLSPFRISSPLLLLVHGGAGYLTPDSWGLEALDLEVMHLHPPPHEPNSWNNYHYDNEVYAEAHNVSNMTSEFDTGFDPEDYYKNHVDFDLYHDFNFNSTNATTANATATAGGGGGLVARSRRKRPRPAVIGHHQQDWSKWRFSTYKCEPEGAVVDYDDVERARLKLAEWGKTRWIGGKRYRGDVAGSAFWYTCNCKGRLHPDPVRGDELQAVQDFLLEHCSRGEGGGPERGGHGRLGFRPGWVWSDEWKKTWAIQPRRQSHQPSTQLCPPHCIWPQEVMPWIVMEISGWRN